MRHLGHDRFSVVGHDRGALVAFRTAMDYPDKVERLVVMDGLPVIEHLDRMNEAFVRTWWHWWFLVQTDKPAEAFISADPGRWYRTPPPAEMGEDNHADVWGAAECLDGLIAAVTDPELLVSAMPQTSPRWNEADDRLFRSIRPALLAVLEACGQRARQTGGPGPPRMTCTALRGAVPVIC